MSIFILIMSNFLRTCNLQGYSFIREENEFAHFLLWALNFVDGSYSL